MNQPEAGPGHSASNPSEVAEYVVNRDGERPLSFAGTQLAAATRQNVANSQGDVDVMWAALYKTKGGKYVTALHKAFVSRSGPAPVNNDLHSAQLAWARQRFPEMGTPQTPIHSAASLRRALDQVEERQPQPSKGDYFKGAVHDTFEDAVAWFRPGKLTDEILRQLGLNEPIRID